MEKLQLISWNVNGIRAAVKKGFYDAVASLNADMLCLQETKAQDEDVKKIAEPMQDYQLVVNSAVKKGYSGTAIFTKVKPINSQLGIGVEEHDQEGRVVALEYEHFYLVNVYVPNSGQGLKRLDYRKRWDADFLRYLKGLNNHKPLVLTGDLNVAHEPIDLARPKPNYNKTAGYTQVEIDGFKAMLDEGWVDSFRKLYPDEVKYSFWNQRFGARERNVGWRIDYFMVASTLMNKVVDATILNDYMGSDHCPVGLSIAPN